MAKYTPVKSGMKIIKEIQDKYAKRVKSNYNLTDMDKRISELERLVKEAQKLGKL